jgi:signal transduction histidine kinase
LQVMADRRRVKQILVNLLSNAVKFTPAGGRVGVEIARIENGAARIAITVWDTGIGIPADQQSRIFECFEQTGGDIYARPTRGIGLGLHIARELARRMGGDLTVVSSPGKGSRFTFTLPAA